MADTPMIVLVDEPAAGRADVRAALDAAGLAVKPHAIQNPTLPAADGVRLVVVDAAGAADAAALLPRWRAHVEDTTVVWIADNAAVRRAGLLGGADAVLMRPFAADELTALVWTLLRRREDRDRLAAQAADSRHVHQTANRFYEQLDADARIARRVQRSCRSTRLPAVAAAQFAVSRRESKGGGGDFYNVARADEDHVAFFLGDVMGGSLTASLLSMFVHHTVVPKEVSGTTYRLLPPDEVLRRLSRSLAGLGAPDPPLVRLTYGLLNARTGSLAYCCAGHTPPLHLPRAGEATLWHAFGPMLGTADLTFPTHMVQLTAGDRVLLFTDGLHGTTPDTHAELLAAAANRRDLPLPSLVECLTQDLLTQTPEPDDFTMLGLEFG